MPQHHPDPSTVLAYAAGSLPTAFAAVLAAHLEVCPSCRAAVRDAERAGARLVEQQDGAALSPGARDALRARLGGTAMAPRPLLHESTPVHDPDLLPGPLQPFFGPRYSTLRWRRVVPGVQYLRAEADTDGGLMLLRIAPGRGIPLHRHAGHELTMILDGAYADALGRFGAGDVADLDEDVEHQPVTVPGRPCICVAATEAPMRFHGWAARALQSVLRL
ncbi:ChrR family anti-sigma-E factor [Luteimonas sp BLCC-B24]|uniref:ChrR family anti-sigma-E factor n=1 Tax=Luteimonas sp. BLCC-B24 TaxID=3025317 RepID=UPI00234E2687|nr:ChrR family anti-sigma-E factor [Luteimonas sp. BLCC-B24]MDC7806984.1 ChrR family anti-sigma-E factor [Luteimonas sp. BLCC-B24]